MIGAREPDRILSDVRAQGVRTQMINSYELGRWFYSSTKGISPIKQMSNVGALLWYHHKHPRTPFTRIPMNIDDMVERWKAVVVGLATAHDKDEADRFEAGVDNCLSPLVAAPVKQIREFAPKLLKVLKEDPRVPFLVWRAYEVWIEQMVLKAPDEGVKELKSELAREIANLVEEDIRPQLGEALVRALQWRSSETLEAVKKTVESEKVAGRKPRLRGRESCLFLEAGGTEDEPAVCVQI